MVKVKVMVRVMVIFKVRVMVKVMVKVRVMVKVIFKVIFKVMVKVRVMVKVMVRVSVMVKVMVRVRCKMRRLIQVWKKGKCLTAYLGEIEGEFGVLLRVDDEYLQHKTIARKLRPFPLCSRREQTEAKKCIK